MIALKNNCSCSQPSVYPADWQNCRKEAINLTWYIQYYFRDPAQSAEWQKKYPYGKLIIIKRMNFFKTLTQRRAAVKIILEHELKLLQTFEYNPITGHRIKAITEPEKTSVLLPNI